VLIIRCSTLDILNPPHIIGLDAYSITLIPFSKERMIVDS
jgi:hypothetical protein